MDVDPGSVLDAALSLSDTQRAGLAYQLLCSLKPPTAISGDNPAFEAELERRVETYESGQSAASDWQDVSQRIRDALARRMSE